VGLWWYAIEYDVAAFFGVDMNDYKQVFKFDNGYGASVVCNGMSYGNEEGLFEVAVLDKSGNIAYDTPVTDDVVGWLDFAEVADILNKIKELKS
jgi:hypothetical protein